MKSLRRNNVVKFYKKDAAQEADVVLEQSIGKYDEVLIVGWDKEGFLEARANLKMTAREILWVIEVFKKKLLNGDYDAS